MMLEKYPHFRKRQKHVARRLFPHLLEVTVSIYFELERERDCNNYVYIKVENFPKSASFYAFHESALIKEIETMKTWA